MIASLYNQVVRNFCIPKPATLVFQCRDPRLSHGDRSKQPWIQSSRHALTIRWHQPPEGERFTGIKMDLILIFLGKRGRGTPTLWMHCRLAWISLCFSNLRAFPRLRQMARRWRAAPGWKLCTTRMYVPARAFTTVRTPEGISKSNPRGDAKPCGNPCPGTWWHSFDLAPVMPSQTSAIPVHGIMRGVHTSHFLLSTSRLYE